MFSPARTTLAMLLLVVTGSAPTLGQVEEQSAEGLISLAGFALSSTAGDGARPGAFKQGSWAVDAFGLGAGGLDDELDATYGGGVGLSYYFRDHLALRGEFIGLGLDQEGDDAAGGGFTLLGRWHFYEHDRLTLYVEGGAGFLQSDVSVPDGPAQSGNDGTHFNFTPQAGLGATYRLRDRLYLTGGARFMHISNADISGDDENPGTNTIGGYVGLMWTF